MNIDISNAHCGPRIQFPDHAWLRVVLVTTHCLRPRASPTRGLCGPAYGAVTAYERSLDVRPAVRDNETPSRERVRFPWASSEMNWEDDDWLTGERASYRARRGVAPPQPGDKKGKTGKLEKSAERE